MKRFRFLLVLAVLLCAAAAVYASSVITVKPSDMKTGETKTIVDDGKTIRITRDGDSVKIVVEGAGKTKKVTILNSADDEIRIGRDDDDDLDVDVPRHGRHRHRRIIINGTPLGELLDRPLLRHHRSQTWFECPKDHVTLRVPGLKEGQSFKCPVDGTVMEQRKGRGFSFYFDSDFDFDGEDL